MKQLRPWRKTGEIVECQVCGKRFYVPKNMLESGRGKYCSKVCYYKSRKGRPMHPNTKKALLGKPPWNKGIKAKDDLRIARFVEAGHKAKKPEPWNKGLRYGKSNWFRLTEGNRYRNLHKIINKKFGKPILCEICNTKNNLVWANKSGKYLKNREDWMSICQKCHMMIDKPNHFGKKEYQRIMKVAVK